MSSKPEPDRERTLLEAVAYTAERLLNASEQPRLAEVLEALGQAAGASRVALFAARTGGGAAPRMEVRHQWAAPGVPRLQPANTGWPRYPGRWREALERGTTIAGPVRDFPAQERAGLEATGSRSVLFVPVNVGDQWYGHLGMSDVAADRVWRTDEVEALRAAAGIVGSSIAHRQTLAALERRTAILGAVGEATALLLESTAWRGVLPRVLDALRTATRARSAWAYGPDPGRPGRRATLLYEVLAPGTRPAGGHTRILDLSQASASLLALGHPVHDRIPASDQDTMHQALKLRGVASWVMVPMEIEPGHLGVLGLDSELPRTWSDGEIEGLHVLAGALRAAIRRGDSLVSVPIVANPWGQPSDGLTPLANPADQPVTADVPVPRQGSGNQD